uniref:DUF4952 domain-containing protein n=1 Tax=Panagrellus redivivus TaxID=6233 RepID=A0A7E4UN12_PANRE
MRRTMLLLLLFFVLIPATIADDTWQDFRYARVKGELRCNGHPLEAWLFLKKARETAYDLLIYFTKFGLFDITAKAFHDGGVWIDENWPGFRVRIHTDCGCGGDGYFELPLVPLSHQFRWGKDAENSPYDYGIIDIKDCRKT